MAKSWQAKGYKTIVLDPFLDPEWNADFITSNPENFLDVVWHKSRGCIVIVDEAGSMVGKFNKVMDELATRGRHWGHKCIFIVQRPKLISTTIRTQCTDIAIFKQSKNDTKDLADEFVEDMINDAHTLNDGEFILVKRGNPPQKLNAFTL